MRERPSQNGPYARAFWNSGAAGQEEIAPFCTSFIRFSPLIRIRSTREYDARSSLMVVSRRRLRL